MESSHPRWPVAALVVLALAFENFWMWADDGLLFGVPSNLAYHLGLCVAASAALWVVVSRGWPSGRGKG